MKYLLVVIMIFILSGCTAKRFYMLSGLHEKSSSSHTIGYKTIGVEDVQIPDYLKEGRIPKKTKHNRIIYIKDALWAVDIAEDLTSSLIFDLQNSFTDARVVHYPWDGNVDLIISVKIKRFIAYDKYVYLDAIVRLNKIDKIVSLTVPVDVNSEVKIVDSMKRAFWKLEREVIAMLDDIEVSKQR